MFYHTRGKWPMFSACTAMASEPKRVQECKQKLAYFRAIATCAHLIIVRKKMAVA